MKVEKPVARHLPEDWHRNNAALRQASHDTRTTSHNLRNESTHFRNQTTNKTWWDNADNTIRLQDRIYEVQRVTDDLDRSLRQTLAEIAKLEAAKETAEAELEARVSPLNTAMECLTLRERRREGDLVKDDIELELHKEVRTLEKSRAELEKVVLDAVSQLRVLHEAKQNLQDDLKDKRAALAVDREQEALTEHSPEISFKPDPLRVPPGTILPADWLEHPLKNMAAAENAIKESQSLRDRMCVTIQVRGDNIVEAYPSVILRRRDGTMRRNRRLRIMHFDAGFTRRVEQGMSCSGKRIGSWRKFGLRRRRWSRSVPSGNAYTVKPRSIKQHCTVDSTLLCSQISALEEQLRASSLPLKVAQTRLEGRTARVRYDLVRDAPQDGLVAEVQHITETRTLLREKLAKALKAMFVDFQNGQWSKTNAPDIKGYTALWDALHTLQRHLRTVDVDLGRKNLSVSLEQKVTGTRVVLKAPQPKESLTQANLTLTGSLRKHPTQIL
ncbi:tektin-2-like [Penaeus indicus]|uniref:tektin-2-like n=1 Tax=Penaeus indicus TaxID=29960 RepID=UPI00300D1D07